MPKQGTQERELTARGDGALGRDDLTHPYLDLLRLR